MEKSPFKAIVRSKYTFGVFYLLVLIAYPMVSYLSYGYDDEFFNINLIEKFGFKTIYFLQHNDVHPPLSYFINIVLIRLLHNWSLVRVCSGLLMSATLIWATEKERRIFGNQYALILFLLLAFNPALLMWCSGIRWYAYFLPVLVYLIFKPIRSGFKAWVILGAGITLLAFIGYIAFLLLVPLILLYWWSNTEAPKVKIKQFIYMAPLFMILYAYQFYVFATVHLRGRGKELTFNVIKNARGYFISQISNQGVFPISAPAIISVLGFLGLVFCILKYIFGHSNDKKSRQILIVYFLVTLLLLVSGLGGKFRNFIVLIPFQISLVMHFYNVLKTNMVYLVSLIMLVLANLWGCVNVIRHSGTTKNSWNMPIGETISAIEQWHNLDGSLLVFTIDPTLTFVLKQRNIHVVSAYNEHKSPEFEPISNVVFINTFRGSMSRRFYDSLMMEEKHIKSDGKQAIKLGYDPYFEWKNKLINDLPEYQVDLVMYQNPKDVNKIRFWNQKIHDKKVWSK